MVVHLGFYLVELGAADRVLEIRAGASPTPSSCRRTPGWSWSRQIRSAEHLTVIIPKEVEARRPSNLRVDEIEDWDLLSHSQIAFVSVVMMHWGSHCTIHPLSLTPSENPLLRIRSRSVYSNHWTEPGQNVHGNCPGNEKLWNGTASPSLSTLLIARPALSHPTRQSLL